MISARDMAIAEAQRAGVPVDFFLRMVQKESGWNPQAVSPAGATGLTQAMPATWQQPGFGVAPGGDMNDPQEQLRFGADYMAAMLNRYGGDQAKAAAAYNWGAGNVDKWGGDMASLPEETQGYVSFLTGNEPITGGGEVPSLMGGAGEDDLSGGGDMPSIMDKQAEEEGLTFHPTLGLQSLGAAIAAGSQGKSAASDLAAIRSSYFKERATEATRQQQERMRQAAAQLFPNNPQLQKYIMEGGDPANALAIAAREDQQAFDAEQAALGRSHQTALQESRLGHDEAKFARSLGLDYERLAEDKRVADLRLELDRDQFNMNTEFGRQDRALKELEYLESLKQAAFKQDLQTAEFNEGIRQFEDEIAMKKQQFKDTHGLSVEEFAFKKSEAGRMERQWAQEFGLDQKKLDEDVRIRDARLALDSSKFDLDTELGRRSADLAELNYMEQLRKNAFDQAMQTDQFAESMRQFDATYEMKKQQFEATHGLSVEQFAFQKEQADTMAAQWAQEFGLDKERFGQQVFMDNAKIDQWGVENEQEATRIKNQNAQFKASMDFDMRKYNEAKKNEQIAGQSAQEFIASTYETLGMTDDAKKVRGMDPAAFSDPAMVNQVAQLMKLPADVDTRTAKMKDWEQYNKIKETDPEGAEQYWAAVNKPTTSVNLGDRADLEWTKKDAATMAAERDEIASAQQALDTLGQMSYLLDRLPEGQDLKTGAIYDTFQTQLDVLNSMGLLPEGFGRQQSIRQQVAQLNTYLATTIKTPGAVSDFEQKAFQRAMPGVGTASGQLKEVIKYHTNRLERAKERALFMETNMRGERGLGYGEAQALWDRKVKRGDPETLPTYKNYDTFAKENLRGTKIGDYVWVDDGLNLIENERDLQELAMYLAKREEAK